MGARSFSPTAVAVSSFFFGLAQSLLVFKVFKKSSCSFFVRLLGWAGTPGWTELRTERKWALRKKKNGLDSGRVDTTLQSKQKMEDETAQSIPLPANRRRPKLLLSVDNVLAPGEDRLTESPFKKIKQIISTPSDLSSPFARQMNLKGATPKRGVCVPLFWIQNKSHAFSTQAGVRGTPKSTGVKKTWGARVPAPRYVSTEIDGRTVIRICTVTWNCIGSKIVGVDAVENLANRTRRADIIAIGTQGVRAMVAADIQKELGDGTFFRPHKNPEIIFRLHLHCNADLDFSRTTCFCKERSERKNNEGVGRSSTFVRLTFSLFTDQNRCALSRFGAGDGPEHKRGSRGCSRTRQLGDGDACHIASGSQ